MRCARCGLEKERAAFRPANNRNGLDCYCRPCRSAYMRAWYRARYPEPPARSTTEKHCAGCGETKPFADFYKRKTHTSDGHDHYCKQCIKSQRAEYYREHKDQRSEYAMRFRVQNRDKILAYMARYRADNPEKVAEGWRANYLKYREQKLAYRKNTREQRRDVIRAGNTRRYVRKKGCAINDFTGPQWTAMKASYGGRCAYCGIVPDVLTQDHVIPLSKGGNHTESNIVPACMPCNNRKKTREAPPRVIVPHERPSISDTVSLSETD